MAPFRELLKPEGKFEWTADLDEAFEKSKVEMKCIGYQVCQMLETGSSIVDAKQAAERMMQS